MPLEGVKVVDLGQGGVGPWAAGILARLGASTIKVEPPWGDWIVNQSPVSGGVSMVYAVNNWMKGLRRLDYTKDEGRAELVTLLAEADVLITNFRPGVLDRHGLGYDELVKINPGLVYCCSTGFGAEGPLADWACIDPHMQAYCGFVDAVGEFSRWYSVIDRVTSFGIAQCVLSGLLARQQTGEGMMVATSMLDAGIYFLSELDEELAELAGDVEVAVLACLDGFIVAQPTERDGAAQLLRILTAGERTQPSESDAWPVLRDLSARRTRRWTLARLRGGGLVGAPLRSIAEIADGAELEFENRSLPGWGVIRLPSFPLHFET
jgi:crotonobetainyl-CoA:carnitine CoA-transferase CaiB-like acyl-CoA transferase